MKLRLPFREDTFFSILVLLVLTVPLVFFMFMYEKFETIKLSAWFILLGAALLALCFSSKEQGRGRRSHPFLLLGLGAMAGLSAGSAAAGGDLINSIFGYFPRLFNGLLSYGLWMATIPILLYSLDRPRLEFLLKVVFFTAMLGSAVAVMQSFGVAFYGGLTSDPFLRSPGLLGNPNFSSLYIVAAIPLGIFFLFQSTKLAVRSYYGVAIFFMVAATILMSSRGALIGLAFELAAVLAGFVVFRFSWPRIAAVLAILAASAALWFGFFGQTRPQSFTQSLNLTETNINLRFLVWDVARSAMVSHPWLGVGPGNFQLYFETQRDRSLASQNGVYDDAHNLFLQFGATMGIPFLLLFFTVLAGASLYGLRRSWKEKDGLALSLVASLGGFCLMACFTPVSSACFLLLAVLLAGLFFFGSKEYEIKPRRIFRAAVGMIGACGIVWGIWFFAGEVLFFRAYNLYFAGKYHKSQSLLSVAELLNPGNSLYALYRAGNASKLGVSDEELGQAVGRFVRMHPGDGASYASAAKIYFQKYLDSEDRTSLKRAAAFMDDSLRRDLYYPQRVSQRALYLFADNQLDDSLQYAKFSLSLYRDNVPGWLLLARIYQLDGRREPAVYALEQAFKIHPEISGLKTMLQQARDPQSFPGMFIPIAVMEDKLE